MKICITAQQNSLNSPVEPRFGRCQYFILFDDETQKSMVVRNSASLVSSGAGIRATQILTDHQVDTLITGRIGPKAANALNNTNIHVVLNATGTAEMVLEQYKNGELKEESRPLMTASGGGRGRGRHGR